MLNRPFSMSSIDDQITRDDEENIHADIAAAESRQADMGSDNRKNRDSAQSIDEWPVSSHFVQ